VIEVRFAGAASGTEIVRRCLISPVTRAGDLVAVIDRLPGRTAIINHGARPATGNIFFDDGEGVYDHELIVALHGSWGYMRMWDVDDGSEDWILAGDPTSPAFVSNIAEFPAGAGVPMSKLVVALTEFMVTARRPESLQWIAEADG
jgi:hypothetical protein